MTNEVRFLAEPIQVGYREKDGEKIPIVEGYAARFNVRSDLLGGSFREIIKPGAFTRALASPEIDVRALVNHDSSKVIGRQKAGTLTVKQDKRGLFYRVELPDTSYARDLMVSMGRGDIAHSSFAFQIGPDGDSWELNLREGDQRYDLRTIHEVSNLADVSPVTQPAYPDATSELVARAMEARSRARSRHFETLASRARAIAASLEE